MKCKKRLSKTELRWIGRIIKHLLENFWRITKFSVEYRLVEVKELDGESRMTEFVFFKVRDLDGLWYSRGFCGYEITRRGTVRKIASMIIEEWNEIGLDSKNTRRTK